MSIDKQAASDTADDEARGLTFEISRKQPSAETPVKQLRGPYRWLIMLVVAGMTGWIHWMYFDMLVAHHAMRSWQEVPATILKAGLGSTSHAKGGTTRQAIATYAYEFRGQSYIAHRVTWDGGSDQMGSFQGDAYQELEAHRASGKPFRCFVDPADPERAILYRDLRPEILVMFSALELWLGLPLVLVFIRWFWDEATSPRIGRGADDAVADESPRARAVWTTIFAVTYNLLTIPLFVYLPQAPAGTFWPWVFALVLSGVGWVIVWQAVVAWRPAARQSPLAILPRGEA